MNESTSDLVLKKLEENNLKSEGIGLYRSNRPWSNSSDSMGLVLRIDGPEYGAFYDHVDCKGGSLYDLALRLDIPVNDRNQSIGTKRSYRDLEEYARAHGVDPQVFRNEGWEEVRYPYEGKDYARLALKFNTKNGARWRFIDGDQPTFKSPKGYKSCWYGLEHAVQLGLSNQQPLVICNGEPSVVVSQHYGVAACAVTGGEKKIIPGNLLEEFQKAWDGEIMIASDCDETGRNMAQGWVSQLQTAGYEVRALDLKGSKGFDLADFCSLFRNQSTAQLKQLNDIFPKNEKVSRLKTRWTIAELLETEFPEPCWAIPGIIPAGLTLFGGRPKVGKSWMMLQAAWSVGTGGKFFNHDIECGNVLYLALEDIPRRLQTRIKAMGIAKDALITFQNEWRPLHKDGLDDLFIELEREEYRLVVIDTLTRAIPGIDQNDASIISPIFDNLQRMALNRNIAVVFIDHTRKSTGYIADPIDDILNTTAKTAIADAILVIYKEKGKALTFLKGRGRDIEEIDLTISWDPTTCCWQCEGNSGDIIMTERRIEIVDVLKSLGKSQVGSIANAIGQDTGNTFRRIQDLVDAGVVRRKPEGTKIYYEL